MLQVEAADNSLLHLPILLASGAVIDMVSENKISRGFKGIAQLVGKGMYEPIQRYFTATGSEQKLSSIERQSPPLETNTMRTGLTSVLPDGTKLVYDILGSQHLERATPMVIICGMTAIREDSGHLNRVLAKSRPGTPYDPPVVTF